MSDTKPTTLWALASLVFGVLGCLACVALVAMVHYYGEIASRSAGVGVIWMVLHMMAAGALCLLAIFFGVVAIVRIGRGQCGGYRQAWTGLVLGFLPLVLALAAFLLSKSDSNPLRY